MLTYCATGLMKPLIPLVKEFSTVKDTVFDNCNFTLLSGGENFPVADGEGFCFTSCMVGFCSLGNRTFLLRKVEISVGSATPWPDRTDSREHLHKSIQE